MLYSKAVRVLYIDMKSQSTRVVDREDLKKYIGGVGIGSKLLEENIHPDRPPLDPDQPMILTLGALSVIFPVITKAVGMFISPLTGEFGECYAAARLSLAMLASGYDAIVMTGKADKPVYLTISNDGVTFHDARPLWGSEKSNMERILYENEKEQRPNSMMHIGVAGENMVSYACVTVDRFRHFGRMGMGAVFGSKHLKAIRVVGDRSVPIQKFPAYFKLYRELYDICTKTGVMSKYHDQGTPINVLNLNSLSALPTLNLRQSTFEHAEKVSGEVFARHHMARKISCAGCPVGCIHIGQFKREFAEKGFEYETINVAYDYELIFALGTFLGLSEPTEILELIEEVEVVGMDAMSSGVVLGWATEALETGLISQEETIVPLKFGSYKEYLTAVNYIATGKNEFYINLARGVRHASSVYGGEDFACHIAGNEMTGYHTGYGSLVGIAVAARHSHLCNAGYSLDQKLTSNDVDPDDFAEKLLNEEIERCLLNSLTLCLFSRGVYNREKIRACFAAVGEDLTDEDLTAAARRIYASKLRVKKMLGFDLKDIKFPKRFFETPAIHGKLDESVAYEILMKYREKIQGLEMEQ